MSDDSTQEPEAPHISYHTDGQGHWWYRQYQPQCSYEMLFGNRCQGVADHDGDHWCYKPNGSYEWASSRTDLGPHDAACGFTPPDHKDYKSPQSMQALYHMNFHKEGEITDTEEIERLERNELRPGESSTKQLSPEEWEEIKRRDREELEDDL